MFFSRKDKEEENKKDEAQGEVQKSYTLDDLTKDLDKIEKEQNETLFTLDGLHERLKKQSAETLANLIGIDARLKEATEKLQASLGKNKQQPEQKPITWRKVPAIMDDFLLDAEVLS